MSDRATLAVLAMSEAFEAVWASVAKTAEMDLITVEEPSELAACGAAAIIVSFAGVEDLAVDGLREVVDLGVARPLVVTAEPDHRLAAELVLRGAGGYFVLPPDVSRLESALTRRREKWEQASRGATSSVDGYDFASIVGEHASIRGALETAGRVIPSSHATVLISGETGTGKELFAKAIHENGPRRGNPFVAVNCSAIPPTLLESELFGHEKGAFTDARAAKPGLFEIADSGTVFLDEISAMPFELQGKLLRFLETREVRRVGGLKERSVDVRILAAANVDLHAMITDREFREDLYYRLAVVTIELPPLRDRGSDAVLLAEHFVEELTRTYGYEPRRLGRDAAAAIQRHSWPGNVRELRNTIERGLLFARDGTVRPDDLAIEVGSAPVRASSVDNGADRIPFPATLLEIEGAAIEAALHMCDGNKSEAARLLGVTRSRFYRLIEKGR